MPRPLSTLLLAVLLVSLLPAAIPVDAAPAHDPYTARLAVKVAADGRFNIGAFPNPQTGEAVSGVSWDLMYRWPDIPNTSFSTIRMDGVDYIYGEDGTQVGAPHDVGMCQALLDTELGEMRCVGDLHRQHRWGSLTDAAPGVKGPLRG